jgi:hypothetical protein
MASSLGRQLYDYFKGSGQHAQAERQASAMRFKAFVKSGQVGSLSHLPYGVGRAVQKLQFVERDKGSRSSEYLSKLIELAQAFEAHEMIEEAHSTYLDSLDLVNDLRDVDASSKRNLVHEGLARAATS